MLFVCVCVFTGKVTFLTPTVIWQDLNVTSSVILFSQRTNNHGGIFPVVPQCSLQFSERWSKCDLRKCNFTDMRSRRVLKQYVSSSAMRLHSGLRRFQIIHFWFEGWPYIPICLITLSSLVSLRPWPPYDIIYPRTNSGFCGMVEIIEDMISKLINKQRQ